MSRYDIQYIDPHSEYLENAWYVAARSESIGNELVSIRLLGASILFYRDTKGQVVALEDACPHRKLPLSMGRLDGDIVHCGYHGLQFDCHGKCVGAPTQDKIPGNAFVRSYPVIERYNLLWIWMGDPAAAGEDKLLQIPDYENEDWAITDGGVLEVRCHYLYLVDNLLDPSHVAWVHKTSFASEGTDDVPLVIEDTESGVLVSRWIENIDAPPYYAEMLPFSGKVDRYQHYEVVLPSIAINIGAYTRAGLGGDNDKLPDEAYRMRSYHFITPIDEHTTRYHWFQHYNTNTTDEAVRQKLNQGARNAFEEDRVILEAVDEGMKRKVRPQLDLGLDVGARMFRKKLAALVEAEKRLL